jgi:DNA-binding transcriptional ArsR family regulator/predicted nucleotidyltransferase
MSPLGLGGTPRRIIEILTTEGELSLTELCKRLGLQKPTVVMHLRKLTSLGAVARREERTSRGREIFCRAQDLTVALIVHPEGHSIISLRSRGRVDLPHILLEQVPEDGADGGEFKEDLRHVLKAIDGLPKTKRPDYVILFGSVARGEGPWKSDLDLCFISRRWDGENGPTPDSVLDKVADVSTKMKHRVNPHFYNFMEFENGDSLLIREIKESGLVIHGDLYRRSKLWRQMRRYKTITL